MAMEMGEIWDTAVSAIYESMEAGRFFEAAPDLIASAAGARSCVLQIIDERLIPQRIAQSWFSDEMTEAYLRERIYEDDVWSQNALEQGTWDRTIDIGAITGAERYTRSRFYQDFIKEYGDDTGQCLGALAARPTGGFLMYGTHRAFGERPFEEDDTRLLDLLNPHLVRAAAIEERLAADQRHAAGLRGVLDRLDRPVIVVGTGGRIKLANQAAEEIAARGDGFSITGGRMVALAPRAQQALARAIGEALLRSGEHGGSLLVERKGGKSPYRLTISPITFDQVTHAMVLLDDPDTDRIDPCRQLRDFYGFTQAEAEVAVLLGKGHSTEEIAELRAVSAATVKSLLQRCFRKSDTRRATQLVRAVNRLPR